MRLENLDKNVEEGYKVLPNIDKERYTEMPGLEGPFQTMSGKPIYYDPKEGAYYDRDTDMYLTYDEFKALDEGMTDKEVNDFHNALDKVVHKHIGHSSDEDEEKERLTKKVKEGKMSPKEELKMLKANVKNPGQSDKAKEKMKARIKELEAMLEEGNYPSKLAKGHKNYKAQQAAVAISKRESKINKVSINQVCEAVKQNDPTIAVAQYVRGTLDPNYKTWKQVQEQVQHILNCINEGNKINVTNVLDLLKRYNLQERADKRMLIKENIDTLRKIVKDKSYQTVKFKDGSMKVDMTTASIFLQAYDKMKDRNQEKIAEMMKTKAGFLKVLDFIYGTIK